MNLIPLADIRTHQGIFTPLLLRTYQHESVTQYSVPYFLPASGPSSRWEDPLLRCSRFQIENKFNCSLPAGLYSIVRVLGIVDGPGIGWPKDT